MRPRKKRKGRGLPEMQSIEGGLCEKLNLALVHFCGCQPCIVDGKAQTVTIDLSKLGRKEFAELFKRNGFHTTTDHSSN